MTKIIPPGLRRGTVDVPSSKSLVHRYLIAAALAGSRTAVHYTGGTSADIAATQACLAALGLGTPAGTAGDAAKAGDEVVLPCGESGTTLRFLLPVAGALGRRAVFSRQGRLAARPLAPFDAELVRHGMTLREAGADLHVAGQLRGGVFRLPGDVSSQFFSGLLFAFPLLKEPAHYEVTGALESAPYVALTESVIAQFRTGDAPRAVTVEGDWSGAAFFLGMGNGVTVRGLKADSAQGDRAIVAHLAAIGGEIDVSQTPDTVPALATAAAFAAGKVTRITHAARLRYKESDRLESTARLLTGLGGDVTVTAEGLVIRGQAHLRGGAADAAGDHRIAMAAALAATRCRQCVTLTGAECVSKSYPLFWEHFESLEREAPQD